jgi:pSer/pThr/pTyr-binding forkhead associated (FHA) protein
MSGPIVLALRLFLTISLYVFLAWAFTSLWRDIRMQGALIVNRKVLPISLAVVWGKTPIRNHRYTQAEVTIGRNPACECTTSDDTMSSHHARLSFHHNHWWLEDLKSTNGTLLNQEKLASPTVVISGDKFQCGKTHFTITIDDEELKSTEKKR